MSQDETRGLNKNLDFMRAISILFLVMNVYSAIPIFFP